MTSLAVDSAGGRLVVASRSLLVRVFDLAGGVVQRAFKVVVVGGGSAR